MPGHIFLVGLDRYDEFERAMNRITIHNEIADHDVAIAFASETDLIAARLLLDESVEAWDEESLAALVPYTDDFRHRLDAITSTLGFTPTSFRRLHVSVREQSHLDLMQQAWPDD